MKKTAIFIVMLAIFAAAASAKTFTFETGSYSIAAEGGFELLKTANTELYLEDKEPVLVKAVFPLKFPDTQVVKEIRLVEFKDPVDIVVDIPTAVETEFMEYDYSERECYESARKPEFFVNDPVIMGNEATYSIEIYPLEIVDCEAARFRLYRTVVYEAVITGSDSRIEYVGVENGAAPGATVPVKIIMNRNVAGTLEIKDITDKVIQAKAITGDREIINLKLPDKYDQSQYILEYKEDGGTVAYKDFIIKTSWGSVEFSVFKNTDPSIIPVQVNITNYMNKEIDASGALELVDWDGNTVKSIDISRKLARGENLFSMDLQVSEEQQDSDIRITLEYDNHEESLTKNTLMRIDVEQARKAQEEYDKTAKAAMQPTAKSNMAGIIAAIVLFIAVLYLVFKYLKKDE